MIKKLSWFIVVLMLFACTSNQDKLPLDPKKDITKKTTAPSSDEEYQQKILDPKDIVSPTQSIKDLDKMIEGYELGQVLTPDQLESNKMLKQKIIQGTFDIKELCRLSLAKHWHEITTVQQKDFVSLMTKLLETKALFSKEQLKGESKLYKINYNTEIYDDAQKTKATVKTMMIIPKDNITLDITYKMILTPYGWKIYDVIVDDASLLTNYQFQFDRIIVKDGFGELIQRMQTKLNELKT